MDLADLDKAEEPLGMHSLLKDLSVRGLRSTAGG